MSNGRYQVISCDQQTNTCNLLASFDVLDNARAFMRTLRTGFIKVIDRDTHQTILTYTPPKQ